MSRPLKRRLDGLERGKAARCRTRFIFQDTFETEEQIQARIRAMIASGVASRNDQFIRFCWGPLASGSTDQ